MTPGGLASRVRKLVALLIALLLLVLGLVGWRWAETPSPLRDRVVERAARFIDPPTAPGDPPISFEVHPGEGAASLAQRLADQGVTQNPLLIRLLLRYYGADREIRAGRYTLPAGTTHRQLIEALKEGQVELVRVTIPEGWRAEEIADELQRNGIGSRDDFLHLVMNPAGRRAPLINNTPPNLEGFLFPDTYLVPPAYAPEQFLELMLANFENRVRADLASAEPATGGLSTYDRLILASIVEREAQVQEEQPVIASTFLNRIRDEMPLAADPTVQYSLKPPGSSPAAPYGYWKRELTLEELKVDTPYNTYLVRGLPPSPIANPGLAAMRAVFHPTPTPYRYFVAKPDGSHAFAATFDEHLNNMFLYQR